MRKSILAAGVALTLVAPTVAEGAEVHVALYDFRDASSKYLAYSAAPGEQNQLTIDAVPDMKGTVRVVDEGAGLTAGTGCTRLSDHEATCRGPVAADVATGDMNDVVRVRTNLSSKVAAGPGDDSVVTAAAPDSLNGGGGNDTLRAGGSDDTVTDGDYPMTGVGPDTLDGGSGHDYVSYQAREGPVSVDVNATGPQGEPGEGDILTGFENATVQSTGDRLTGDDRANVLQSFGSHGVLRGRGGDDSLDADWAGRDFVSGGPGNDYLRLSSESFIYPESKVVPDKISCGRGRDEVSFPVEQQFVPLDCEIVDYDSFEDPIFFPRGRLAGTSSQIVKIVPQGCGRLDVRKGRCHLTWAIREKAPGGGTRGPLLASRSQSFPKDATGRPVALRLTRAGRRVLRRRGGLDARIGILRGGRLREGYVMRLQLARKP
jgi:hypothetical protein